MIFLIFSTPLSSSSIEGPKLNLTKLVRRDLMCDLLFPGFTSKNLPGTQITFSFRHASKSSFRSAILASSCLDWQIDKNHLEVGREHLFLEP